MILRVTSGIVIGLVVVTFFLYNLFFSVNFPFQDDFLLIQFIEAISGNQTSPDQLVNELFRTFNDHKAVIPRLIALIEYNISGHLNFRFYILLVQINIIYIFSFVYIQFRKTRLPVYYFLPAPFLFFQPLFHEISGWALNGMQHTFLMSFTVTAILLASTRTNPGFYLAMVCCFLAAFTHGNGVLSFPTIIFYYLCLRDFRKAIMTGVFMAITLGIYLIGYESGQAVNLPNSIVSFLYSFLGFIGSEMSLWSYPKLLSALWGLVIIAFMTYLIAKVARTGASRPGTIELLTLFVMIAITSLVIALFRSWMGTTIASRFQIYAVLSTVLFYVLLLDYTQILKKCRILLVITGLSVAYWIYAYYHFTSVVAAKKTVYLADVYNWSTNHNMFSVEKSLIKNADFYLTPAYRKGFFKLPRPIINKKQLDSLFQATRPTLEDYKIYIETWTIERQLRDGHQTLEQFFINSLVGPKPKHLFANRFLVLRNSGLVHLMSANPKVNGRRNILKGGPYFKAGFNTQIRTDDLATGIYELGLLNVESDGSLTFYRLNKSMRVVAGRVFLQ